MDKFDAIIIGSGSAGQSAAYPLAKAGWKIAVSDDRPFGGTCALRGCDPKKVLVAAAEAIDWTDRLSQQGIVQPTKIAWGELAKFKKSFVENTPMEVEKGLKEAGIKTFSGTARFIDRNTVSVNEQTLRAKHFVIATGATPLKLNIPGEEYLTLSDDFLDLEDLPERIVFIGGGYISFEFAHIAKRAGAKVSILHRSERVLKEFDRDLVDLLVDASEDLGIDIKVNSPVVEIKKINSALLVKTEDGKTYKTDLVVHGSGRVANLEKLNLGRLGIEYSSKGVKVNEYLQSSASHIYAAGDASDYGLPLTPVAGKEGSIVAHNLLNSKKKKANFKEMPSVVFTIPPLASVGLGEDEAKEKGLDFEVNFSKTRDWYSSKRINEKHSGYKTLVEKKTKRILGAHLLGHSSDEVINVFALAIANNMISHDLKELLYSYPTRSSDIEYMI